MALSFSWFMSVRLFSPLFLFFLISLWADDIEINDILSFSSEVWVWVLMDAFMSALMMMRLPLGILLTRLVT